MSRVFANGSGDGDSIPDKIIPKTQKMVLEAALLNTLLYKVQISGKVEQSKEWSSTLPYHLGVVAIEIKVVNFSFLYLEVSRCRAAVLWSVATSICSKYVAFFARQDTT